MTGPGLRERKKARTRQVIADAAARLFAQRGYEQVAVSDVAREAEVSEQTVYNYFRPRNSWSPIAISWSRMSCPG